jgi:hypothetical protein
MHTLLEFFHCSREGLYEIAWTVSFRKRF